MRTYWYQAPSMLPRQRGNLTNPSSLDQRTLGVRNKQPVGYITKH